MAFTPFETNTANISTLSDRPNQNDGLSSTQLKGRFDKAGNDIKSYINDVLLDELERTTDGDSGADNIGATAVGDGTATTVQGILEEIDADVTALDGAVVHKTGNETIDDVKTFTSSPVVPTPTADTNPATKKYVDDLSASDVEAVATTDIVNTLTETAEGKVLDARQGKTLSDKIGAQTYTEQNYITDAEPLTTSLDALDMSLKDTADLVSAHTGATNPHGITKTTVGLDNVDNVKQATTTTYTTTLDTTWSGTKAPYTKEQTVTGILSTDNPIVDIVLSGTYATDSKIEADWAEIYRIVTSANSVTLYAHKKPTNSIPLQFKVVR